jgi:DNA-binding transcriptional MerR regulator
VKRVVTRDQGEPSAALLKASVAATLIGELAKRAATSTRTLRYYEARGLVRARRAANGYRVYDEAELRVVDEIRALLAVGFGVDDIRPFVACLRAGNTSGGVCPDSVAVLRRKLAEVDACVNELDMVRSTLRTQLAQAVADREDACRGNQGARW